jgi:hypothetical protein
MITIGSILFRGRKTRRKERVYLQFGLGKKAPLFAHHLLVDTSTKRKKKKGHKTILNHAAADQRRKKRERRRKKEEKKRKKKKQRRVSPALTSPDLALLNLARSRRRPTVCFFVFFQPWVSQPHLAVTVPGFFLVLG